MCQFEVFHEVCRHLSPERVMAFPECYLFSIHIVNIHNKENRTKFFRLIRTNYDYELQWFYLGTEKLIPPHLTQNWSRYLVESACLRIPVRTFLSIRKTFLHFLLIMISVQVVIFAAVSKPYLMNDFQSFLNFTYFLSRRKSYAIPVRKLIFVSFIQEQI
jgi:hypothetical protein